MIGVFYLDVKATVLLMVVLLLVIGGIAVGFAVVFGKRYQAGGSKQQKYFCVACCVLSCVCVITVIQITLMFRQLL